MKRRITGARIVQFLLLRMHERIEFELEELDAEYGPISDYDLEVLEFVAYNEMMGRDKSAPTLPEFVPGLPVFRFDNLLHGRN